MAVTDLLHPSRGASNTPSAPAMGGSNPARASSKPTPMLLCPNCGDYCPMAATGGAVTDDNGRRIAELEAQVTVLQRKVVDAGK